VHTDHGEAPAWTGGSTARNRRAPFVLSGSMEIFREETAPEGAKREMEREIKRKMKREID